MTVSRDMVQCGGWFATDDPIEHGTGGNMTEWQKKLDGFFRETEKQKSEEVGAEVIRFLNGTVSPAMEEFRKEMEKHGRDVSIRNSDTSVGITVLHGGEEELTYRVQCRMLPSRVVPYVEMRFRERKGLRLIRTEINLREVSSEFSLADISKEEIIQNLVENYVKRVKPD